MRSQGIMDNVDASDHGVHARTAQHVINGSRVPQAFSMEGISTLSWVPTRDGGEMNDAQM